MNRQRIHWDNEAYSFGDRHEGENQVNHAELEGNEEINLLEDEADAGFYLSKAKDALLKLNQHEARRAKAPQRMRVKSAWE